MAQRTNAMIWGTPVERERRRRITLSVWAYAIEFMNTHIVKESEFDFECRMVKLDMITGDARWDQWWKDNFKIGTTAWIRKHPYQRELHLLAINMIANHGIYIVPNNRVNQLPRESASQLVESCEIEDCNCQGTGHNVTDPVDPMEDGDWCKISEPPKIKEQYPQEEAA